MSEVRYIVWTFIRVDGPPYFCSDLPGCEGCRKNLLESKSDWGYSEKQHLAISLTETQKNKFSKYQEAVGRSAHCQIVRRQNEWREEQKGDGNE